MDASGSFVVEVVKVGADIHAGVFGSVLNIKAGLLELIILGNAVVAVLIGVHSGQVEGIHGVFVLFQINDVAVLIQHLDVQAQGLEFLNQDLKGLRHAGLGYVVALDDSLVGPDTPVTSSDLTVRISWRV